MNQLLKRTIIFIYLIGFMNIIDWLIPMGFAQSNIEHSMGLVIPQQVVEYWKNNVPTLKSYKTIAFPSAMDWSVNDSFVKYQGGCGSCWAFTAVALVENLGEKADLSEQVIVSCATGSCSGGWYGDALKYIHDYGIPVEECYQYIASDGNCTSKCENPEYLEQVANYDYYGRWGKPTASTVTDLKSLLQSGPVCVSMLVPEDGTFENYSGGVYNYEGGAISPTRGHAVLVVGYNDIDGYFKAKNSWSGGWGESGYFRISYDDVTDDVEFGGYAVTASGVYTTQLTPVELTSFSATVHLNNVTLDWQTTSETNNYGFDIERSIDGKNYIKVDFVKGFGTTTIPQSYSFTDENLVVGKYYYRLKQIDFDGRVDYSTEIVAKVKAPAKYSLTQNYPNPFNSETRISFQLPDFNLVSFTIYNALGQEVKTLFHGNMSAGFHAVSWDGRDENGRNAPSGFYYYQIKAGNFVQTRRLVLLR